MARWTWYAVQKGRQPGLYRTWGECAAQVDGFPGARFKGFGTRRGAEGYVGGDGGDCEAARRRGGDGPESGRSVRPLSSPGSSWPSHECRGPTGGGGGLSKAAMASAESSSGLGASGPGRGIFGMVGKVIASLLDLGHPPSPPSSFCLPPARRSTREPGPQPQPPETASSTSTPARFYAVATGRRPGVYPTWRECEAQVRGVAGARFGGFATRAEAEGFLAVCGRVASSRGSARVDREWARGVYGMFFFSFLFVLVSLSFFFYFSCVCVWSLPGVLFLQFFSFSSSKMGLWDWDGIVLCLF